MSIDGKLLNQAIQNVATEALIAELREAIVFGPPVLSKVLAEYQNLSATKAVIDELDRGAEELRKQYLGLTDEQADAAVDAWFDEANEKNSWQDRMRAAFAAVDRLKGKK